MTATYLLPGITYGGAGSDTGSGFQRNLVFGMPCSLPGCGSQISLPLRLSPTLLFPPVLGFGPSNPFWISRRISPTWSSVSDGSRMEVRKRAVTWWVITREEERRKFLLISDPAHNSPGGNLLSYFSEKYIKVHQSTSTSSVLFD